MVHDRAALRFAASLAPSLPRVLRELQRTYTMRNVTTIALTLLFLGSLAQAAAPTESDLLTQRHQAFRTMTAGYPMQAAVDLLNGIHALPTDDPAVLDYAGGNLQLLLFDTNLLMTEPMRNEFFTKLLDTKENEIDALIATLHEASLKLTPEQAEDFLGRLWKYSQSSNDLVAGVALYLLADPYYTEDMDIGIEASHEMVTRYPNLEATRNMLALPIYHRKLRPAIAGEWIRAYKGKPQEPGKPRIRETTNAEKNVAAQDPFITNVEPLVDYLSQNETKRKGIEGLLALLADENTDWRDRYSYLRMLEPEMKPQPGGTGAQGYWKLIQPGVESLANRGELTPDVYHARVLLCEVESAAGEFEDASYWAERLLTEQERLYEHPERILYEETIRVYTEFAESLEKGQLYEEAAKTYERLGDYYPNSAIAIQARQLASEAREKSK